MDKKKSERKKLRDKLDKVFSEYIRARDNYTCVVCGATRNTHVIQCGHLFSRVAYSTRWDELNAHAQCDGCNRLHETMFEPYRRAWLQRHTQEEYDTLYQQWCKSRGSKLSNHDLQILIEKYQNKLEALNDNR